MARRALKITLFYFKFQICIFNQSPLNCRYLHSSWVVSAKLERDQFWVLFFGCDLHHRVQSLSGLDVGESFPRGDLPQAVHVSCCDQQVAGKDNRLTKSVSWFRDCWIMTTPLVDSCWRMWRLVMLLCNLFPNPTLHAHDSQGRCVSGCQVTNSFTHLGNMWPVSFTSLHGMWCFTSGLFIQVWMLTISFLSSSDMDELSISSKAHKIQVIIFVFKIKVNLLLIKVLTLSKYDWFLLQLHSGRVYLYHTPLHHQYWTQASPRGKVCLHGRCCSRAYRWNRAASASAKDVMKSDI